MRAVIQRVSAANLTVEGVEKAKIGQGLLVLLGVEPSDTLDDLTWLAAKVVQLRIFSDEKGLMNLSISDLRGQLLVVSQFTLFAATKKGNRPSFVRAAKPDFARSMYQNFVEELVKISHLDVQTGEFGADMKVTLLNDGPVTIWIDTKNRE